jgi:putative ABC transport system substrate-binding protein
MTTSRRQFISLLGGAAATWPAAARAQQGERTIPRIGLVSIGADPANPANFVPFLQEFRGLGYIEGQNVIVERRFAAGQADLIAGFVADLVARNVNVIVTTGSREVEAARRATASIPIVTMLHPDLVGMGFAQSLAKPGGNVTGLTVMEPELDGKRIEILKQAVPGLQKIGVMISRVREDYRNARRGAAETAARSLNVSVEFGEFDMDSAEAAISAVAARGVQGLVYPADGVSVSRRKEIADRAISHKLPTIFALRPNVDAGAFCYTPLD